MTVGTLTEKVKNNKIMGNGGRWVVHTSVIGSVTDGIADRVYRAWCRFTNGKPAHQYNDEQRVVVTYALGFVHLWLCQTWVAVDRLKIIEELDGQLSSEKPEWWSVYETCIQVMQIEGVDYSAVTR